MVPVAFTIPVFYPFLPGLLCDIKWKTQIRLKKKLKRKKTDRWKERGNKFQEGQVKEGWIALAHHVLRAHGWLQLLLFFLFFFLHRQIYYGPRIPGAGGPPFKLVNVILLVDQQWGNFVQKKL